MFSRGKFLRKRVPLCMRACCFQLQSVEAAQLINDEFDVFRKAIELLLALFLHSICMKKKETGC